MKYILIAMWFQGQISISGNFSYSSWQQLTMQEFDSIASCQNAIEKIEYKQINIPDNKKIKLFCMEK